MGLWAASHNGLNQAPKASELTFDTLLKKNDLKTKVEDEVKSLIEDDAKTDNVDLTNGMSEDEAIDKYIAGLSDGEKNDLIKNLLGSAVDSVVNFFTGNDVEETPTVDPKTVEDAAKDTTMIAENEAPTEDVEVDATTDSETEESKTNTLEKTPFVTETKSEKYLHPYDGSCDKITETTKDADGNLLSEKQTFYKADGSVQTSYETEYKNGVKTKTTSYDSDAGLMLGRSIDKTEEHQYDETGNLISRTIERRYVDDGSNCNSEEYTYYDNGNVKSQKSRGYYDNKKGSFASETLVQYDINGNEVSKTQRDFEVESKSESTEISVKTPETTEEPKLNLEGFGNKSAEELKSELEKQKYERPEYERQKEKQREIGKTLSEIGKATKGDTVSLGDLSSKNILDDYTYGTTDENNTTKVADKLREEATKGFSFGTTASTTTTKTTKKSDKREEVAKNTNNFFAKVADGVKSDDLDGILDAMDRKNMSETFTNATKVGDNAGVDFTRRQFLRAMDERLI